MEMSQIVQTLKTLQYFNRYKLFGRVTDGHRTMADCVSQHLRSQGKALVSVANCSSGNMVDADGNPVPGTSSGSGVTGMSKISVINQTTSEHISNSHAW